MALKQRPATPSSFDNYLKLNLTNISSFPTRGLENGYSALNITFFNKDNQKPAGFTLDTDFWSSPVIPQDKLIELDEYKGFSFVERGKIAVSYKKDDVDFLYNFKFVCLNRQEHNDYYPDPYLIVCFELELEGSGKSKDEALKDLYQLLDVYFNRTREISENPAEYKNIINNNINQQNLWKQSFARTYDRAQELGLVNTDYQHHIFEE